MEEYFKCPVCSLMNLVIWDKNQTERNLDCIGCRRTVSAEGLCTCQTVPRFRIYLDPKDDTKFEDVVAIHNEGFSGRIEKGLGFTKSGNKFIPSE